MAKEKLEKKNEATEVTVSWRGMTRVYSENDHGKDFEKLAKEFAGKVGGQVA
jgi:hypothetical protein